MPDSFAEALWASHRAVKDSGLYLRIVEALRQRAAEERVHRIFDWCFHGKKRPRVQALIDIRQSLKGYTSAA